MANDTKEVNIHTMIKEQFTKLPPKLQKAITSTDVSLKLREISQKNRLHIDQGQILENETYMVLLGIEEAQAYEKNLKKELNISAEMAKGIAQDVAKEIFLSIRNLLKESVTATPRKATPGALRSNAQPTGALRSDASTPNIKTESRPLPTSIVGMEDKETKEKTKEIPSLKVYVSPIKHAEGAPVENKFKPEISPPASPTPTLSTPIPPPSTLTPSTTFPLTPSIPTPPAAPLGETADKLESVVKTKQKEIKVAPSDSYTADPYREPIE